jgi:DNA-binding transcriptional MerR regulator
MSEQSSRGFRIGAVALRTGLSIYAIRFYEKEGLLERLPRTESGYRLFSSQEIDRLRFITRSRDMGFSLIEIGELLSLRRKPEACKSVQTLLEQKLATIRTKMSELQELETELLASLGQCRKRGRSPAPTNSCALVSKIEQLGGVIGPGSANRWTSCKQESLIDRKQCCSAVLRRPLAALKEGYKQL